MYSIQSVYIEAVRIARMILTVNRINARDCLGLDLDLLMVSRGEVNSKGASKIVSNVLDSNQDTTISLLLMIPMTVAKA
jgi:hypothetical protein